MKSRIESLKNQDLLGQKNSQINQLKERVAALELALSGQRNQVRQLTEKKESIRTHVVVAGDTLQSIAKEYYGDANQWKKIYNANADKIERGLPKVGSKLVIP
jgi:nucleoid-associated protein YgaU